VVSSLLAFPPKPYMHSSSLPIRAFSVIDRIIPKFECSTVYDENYQYLIL
jgi:hypothetical protein